MDQILYLGTPAVLGRSAHTLTVGSICSDINLSGGGSMLARKKEKRNMLSWLVPGYVMELSIMTHGLGL